MAREAIFIGYRRDDTADVAGRIYDALEARFGQDRVFKDVDNIPVGADFGDYINGILPRCRVALILIGPSWVHAKDGAGQRRIDDPHDWVRVEVETALATSGLQVVPVLVNGAQMPRAEDLPASIQPLLRRNAANIRRDPDFRDDIERLATALRASVRTGFLDLGSLGGGKSPAPVRSRRRGNPALVLGGVIAAAAVLAVGFQAWRFIPSMTADGQVEQPASPTTGGPQASDASVSSSPSDEAPAPGASDVAAQTPSGTVAPTSVSAGSTLPPAPARPVQAAEVHTALMSLDAPELRSLLARGWNPNTPLDTDTNAALHDLMMVCERDPSHNPDAVVIMARILINAGANPHQANKFGDTPLTIASSPRYCGASHPVVSLLR